VQPSFTALPLKEGSGTGSERFKKTVVSLLAVRGYAPYRLQRFAHFYSLQWALEKGSEPSNRDRSARV
jgi:hypothetical protein